MVEHGGGLPNILDVVIGAWAELRFIHLPLLGFDVVGIDTLPAARAKAPAHQANPGEKLSERFSTASASTVSINTLSHVHILAYGLWYLKSVDFKSSTMTMGDMADRSVKATFGQRLRELRRQRGWSQERLAMEVGLDRSYVGSVERGERNISLENIAKFARTFNLPLSDLMDLDGG